MTNSIKRYGTTARSLMIMLVLLLGSTSVWGQDEIDYSGIKFIRSLGKNTGNNTYLLCPTINYLYYDASNPNSYTTTDNGQPFLTTYPCKDNNNYYEDKDALWYIEKHPSLNCYYIKRYKDGKYLVYNDVINNAQNTGRIRVHIESLLTSPDDKFLFEITPGNNQDFYSIKTIVANAPDNKIWVNVSSNNQYNPAGTGNNQGSLGKGVGGTIGLWTGDGANDQNSKWTFDETTYNFTATPVITNNFDGTATITATEGNIFCTTDGSVPTTEMTSRGSSYTFTIPSGTTVIRAIAKVDDKERSIIKDYFLPQCPEPIINNTKGIISITSSLDGSSIYYSTSESGNDWIEYNNTPFPLGSYPVVRAKVTHVGYVDSDIVLYYGAVYASSASYINSTGLGRSYLIDEDFDANAVIGTSDAPFTGTIDGQMHTITGLTSALVNIADGAIIKNVILKDVEISSGSTAGNVGAICNEAKGATRIYNCGVLGTITETETKDPNTGVVTINVSGSSTISGSKYVGSIVGLLDGTSRVINCYSYAVIQSGGDRVGGIAGYNNVNVTNPANASTGQKTMVMNCMFYGDILGTGTNRNAPIYNGYNITNVDDNKGVSNFNYFRVEARYVQDQHIDVYNCALAAETRFLNRFEFFRHLLNSNRALAAWWATGDKADKDEMMKWELETADRTITSPNIPYPYPILKPVKDNNGKYIQYPSVVNIDATNAPAFTDNTEHKESPRNEGCKFNTTFTVKIRRGSLADGQVYDAPTGARILKENGEEIEAADGTRDITLNITDKDPDRFNFNYYKIQLPYYNDYGTKNYTEADDHTCRVVTGWKIVSMDIEGPHAFSTGDMPADASASVNADGDITLTTPYNFADRKSTQKDLYDSNGHRIFNQGAYFDVPEGVTSITIEPYWAKCVFVADEYMDVVYNKGMGTAYPVTTVGGGKRYGNSKINIGGTDYDVQTTLGAAVEALSPSSSDAVYDNAIVLVGNVHSLSLSSEDSDKPFTIMSIDQDKDNEPDYSYILRFNERKTLHPVRIDFLNVIGLGMAQKSYGGTGTYNFGIMQPRGWFEVTNTGLFRVTQFEYDFDGREESPMILQGGVIEQWVTVGGQSTTLTEAKSVNYYHVGGNVWFKEFHIGVHQDKYQKAFVSPHPPISVTGGDFDEFYLTGLYNTPDNTSNDNAECYINGGRFGKVAGTGMQGIGKVAEQTGNIVWQIDNADIDEFYGGGINFAHVAEGNITTVISNSRVDLFCGGPKFGDMKEGKKVATNATNCTFRTFFGAGYGGNSYNRRYPDNKYDKSNYEWDPWVEDEYKNRADYEITRGSEKVTYEGVETRIDYQFIPKSDGTLNVARLFVDYISFSLATTRDVTSKLTGCTITTEPLGRLDLFEGCVGSFYGGGSLGKVSGPVKSTLIDCSVDCNVYGAGYSATLPPVSVMVKKDEKWFQKEPKYDTNLGAFLEAKLPATVSYTWVHSETNGLYEDLTNPDKPIREIRTTATLTGLGTVSGNVTLTVSGDNTVVKGSIFGGGQDSDVEGDTYVTVTGGTIGTYDEEQGKYLGGAYYGNVYGGGMGTYEDETKGTVKGNTNVTISGTPTIYHNVYGGGAFGSVGTFTYGPNNIPTADTWTDTNTGTCKVTILGGTFGTTGKDNGMICGASRGDDEHYYMKNEETGEYEYHDVQVNKLAWVYDTQVVIGNSDPKDESNIHIVGSVYGGGENGHNLHNASVKIYKGTIGVEDEERNNDYYKIVDNENGRTYYGPEYPNRGNVYGAGCGTDNYKKKEGEGENEKVVMTIYNPMAGIICGNTNVEVYGGKIVRNVYGAGAMASVGTYNIGNDGKVIGMLEGKEDTGLCTVTVSGGQIGTTDMMMKRDSGYPDDWGYVFGGGRGNTLDPEKSNIENVQYVNTTDVTISGKAFITGSVYGGAENGHVLSNTWVKIQGGQIGCGAGKTKPYTEDEWTAEDPSSFTECAHWDFTGSHDPYDVYKDDNGDGKPDWATDGHTFYGNVFGGGSGYFPYGKRDETELAKLLEVDSGYADGLWLPSAGWVGGNTRVDITGGHILTSVYGGNECTDVDGSCTVNMSGGTVGVPRNFVRNMEVDNGRLVTCYVFGAGKGDQRINFNQWTNVKSTKVNISGKARIFGSTFGGGEDGHVLEDVETNIIAGEVIGGIQYPYIGTTGTSGADGNVFGGGRGYSETALTAGAVCGNVKIDISGGTMLGTVFGGGRLAPVGTHIVLAESDYYGQLIEDGKKQVFGDKDLYKQLFDSDGNRKDPFDIPDEDASGVKHGYITINISGGTIGAIDKNTGKLAVSKSTIGDVFGGCKGTMNSNLPFGLSRSTSVTISETELSKPHIHGRVFGGGEAGNVEELVTVNVNGGTVDGDVYGGGALADTNTRWTQMTAEDREEKDKADYSTYINLHGGTIGGRVFGGGLGRKASNDVTAVAAIVGGDVTVKLNENTSSDDCVVKQQIFGCNNLNGTPRGNVTVHVYKTQGWDDNIISEEKKNTKYELDAVYGGGNEAAYVPEDTYTVGEDQTITYHAIDEEDGDAYSNAYKTNVIIDGCDMTSIRWVYGGGNSAPTPATCVTVNSCYEIGTVFGGGNGAENVDDGTPEGMPNLGANVGYRNYSYVDNEKVFHDFYDETYPEDIRSYTKEYRVTNYKYGTGRAETRLYGGTIHNAFGGSNTRGNVCSVAFSALQEMDENCNLVIGQIYGAGNKAFMDAKIEVDLGCVSGLDQLFGGAVEADVNDNVLLDVTSGSYHQIFGGNNKGGKISGTITVNVKEVGCNPIEIDELYGGGNEADYEAPLDEHGNRIESPVVNIVSATKIGTVYGGGRLANVTGNPVVKINMEEGLLYSEDDKVADIPQPIGTVGTVFGGGYKGWIKGNTHVEIGTDPTKKANILNSVYGGGDDADVIGHTEVIIGTPPEETP